MRVVDKCLVSCSKLSLLLNDICLDASAWFQRISSIESAGQCGHMCNCKLVATSFNGELSGFSLLICPGQLTSQVMWKIQVIL